jgi:hypothetical protein
LAADAKLLFFGGIISIVILVVFSKKRAIRVFIVAFCAIGGIIGLDVKKGGLVC